MNFKNEKTICCNGTVYSSLKEMCRAHNIEPRTFQERVRRGSDKPLKSLFFNNKSKEKSI